MRDLALAVIEGAVAAESLARELKKAPDRSRHFQEIAERLRSVVGRASIRSALTEERAAMVVSAPPLPAALELATQPRIRPAEVVEPDPAPEEPRPIVIEPVNTQQLDRIEAVLRALAGDDRMSELSARIARLEEALSRVLDRRDEGERYALRTPEEAIALAARLTERLRRDPRVVVRIEP